ncbi:hypothetical protein BU25DRAFT_474049 [Macroventuria anomochaeta]|uniref:Uncharacterized protein n=1 Tax=Macroventuria anomochaeta TaxID=301207 RepID=A0ACB6RUE4_9PLEO|nr:uncharacterized protein BU25DRAFT_474049 [Macroventuria anomochaeta]KAF2625413.1 hypothetical protein BU25DRAFT_474049 [Macroventuria anomochaeta]
MDLGGIAELSKHKIERAKALDWAMNDIKFPVYDDTDVKVPRYDSDDEDGMLVFAQRMCYDDGVVKVVEASSSHKEHAHGSESFACHVCSTYPEFPHAWRPHKSLTVGHLEIKSRHHDSTKCEASTDKFANQALDDVLDLAVDIAKTCMIWIDQECLSQLTKHSFKADEDEQELDINSKDIVYNRAIVTAGLLDVEIDTQAQLDVLEALMFLDKARVRSMIDYEFCYLILGVLYRTSVEGLRC